MSDAALHRARSSSFRGALVLLLALPACGDVPAEDARRPSTGGTAVVGGQADLAALNPLSANENTTEQILRHGLFVALVGQDAEGDYVPALAESWSAQGDSAVVFRLRRDLRWHDGVPTTARDVAFTFARVKDPATGFPYAGRFQRWTSAEALDSFTVRATLEPHIDALTAWATTPLAPAHLLDSVPPERTAMAAFGRRPVGNGPFRFVEWRAGDRLVLEANPDFPEGLGGRPRLDRVVYRVLPDLTSQLAELATGQLDLVLNVPVGEVPRLAERGHIIEGPRQQFAFIGWNGRRGVLSDARVRRALTLAVDRQAMVELLRGGYGGPAVGPVPPTHWAFASDLRPLPFDTAAAGALLEQASVLDRDGDGRREGPDGVPLRIELKFPSQDPVFRSASQLVASDLARVGVTVVPTPVEGSTLIGQVTSAERPFDAILLTWNVEDMAALRGLFHSEALDGPLQLAGYQSARADSLLDVVAAASSRERAAPAWRELQAVLSEEQPWSFLYYFSILAARSARLQGVEMDVRGQLASMPGWWIGEPDAATAGR
ncbi:MAG TPA: ABC transporter substrate-binding protein [Longimicrobiales bacterium]|nr:ABC transporter substrate-binding protein [Longimicrobiales bacterium]